MPLLHASLARSILTEAAVNAAPRGAVEGNMNRRTAVGVLGGLAFGTVAAAWGRRAFAQPVCTLTPEQIEGPFYLDQARMREAISEDKPGVPLQLILRVVEASASCAPISKAPVDVWQCDALGIYSGYEGAAIAPRHVEPVDDKTFLRGAQLTDAAGAVRFRTIYPGWVGHIDPASVRLSTSYEKLHPSLTPHRHRAVRRARSRLPHRSGPSTGRCRVPQTRSVVYRRNSSVRHRSA